jgi:hypothetical protein
MKPPDKYILRWARYWGVTIGNSDGFFASKSVICDGRSYLEACRKIAKKAKKAKIPPPKA